MHQENLEVPFLSLLFLSKQWALIYDAVKGSSLYAIVHKTVLKTNPLVSSIFFLENLSTHKARPFFVSLNGPDLPHPVLSFVEMLVLISVI